MCHNVSRRNEKLIQRVVGILERNWSRPRNCPPHAGGFEQSHPGRGRDAGCRRLPRPSRRRAEEIARSRAPSHRDRNPEVKLAAGAALRFCLTACPSFIVTDTRYSTKCRTLRDHSNRNATESEPSGNLGKDVLVLAIADNQYPLARTFA